MMRAVMYPIAPIWLCRLTIGYNTTAVAMLAMSRRNSNTAPSCTRKSEPAPRMKSGSLYAGSNSDRAAIAKTHVSRNQTPKALAILFVSSGVGFVDAAAAISRPRRGSAVRR